MDNKEVHKIVSSIKTNLFKNSNSFSIGMLKSHFRGSGLKFKEHQVYTHGDDVRFIDWRMLAKTSVPYIKTFEEERNVEITILLDCSESMLMGLDGKSKLEAAIEISSLIYLLAGMTKDYVQVIICDGVNIYRVQKKNGELGIVALVNTLKRIGLMNEHGKINHAYYETLTHNDLYENEIVKEFYRKRELVILSDFYNFLTEDKLKRLVARKHVHAFRMLTPLDEADDFKYSIYTGSFANTEKKSMDVKLLRLNQEISTSEIKFKNLKLENRYLEEFVKEML